MDRYRGVSASGGIAIGPAYLAEVRIDVAERLILRSDRAAEVARIDDATAVAERQLERLHRQLDGADGTAHELIDLHRVILRSPELADESPRLIERASSTASSGCRIGGRPTRGQCGGRSAERASVRRALACLSSRGPWRSITRPGASRELRGLPGRDSEARARDPALTARARRPVRLLDEKDRVETWNAVQDASSGCRVAEDLTR
jgi:hypothetical protein